MTVPMKKRRIYDPFDQLRLMQREMDDLFENFFEHRPGRAMEKWGVVAPKSDIVDKGDSFELKADLPGMDKEDIKIEVGQDNVTISAERKGEKEEKKKNYYYHERTYSGYRRTFALPAEVDPNKVQAEFKNGVLSLNMKKVKLPPPKKREIKLK
jgi:HSP20 family protein